MIVPLSHLLAVSAGLFAIGLTGRYLSFWREGQAEGDERGPFAEGVNMDAAIRVSPVAGLHIAALGYNQARMLLVCQFLGGATYVYRKIPKALYAELLSAPSKGSFLQRRVVGHHAFPFERIR